MCLTQTLYAFILPIPEKAHFLFMYIDFQLEVMYHFINFCLKIKAYLTKMILSYHGLSKKVFSI